ncbi:MAG: beta-glucosidase, partial [Deinococcus sp.]
MPARPLPQPSLAHRPGLFQSFFMGGFECSCQRLRSGRRLDVIRATRHDELALPDYRRLSASGIRAARDGARWHLIERSPGVYDFSSWLPMLRAAREAGVQVIWDLCHYGWPDDLDPFGKEFTPRFAAFVRACAEVLTAEGNAAPFVCLINEVSFLAWGGGDVGYLNPFLRGHGTDLKVRLVRASLAGMDALWSVLPQARVVHT